MSEDVGEVLNRLKGYMASLPAEVLPRPDQGNAKLIDGLLPFDVYRRGRGNIDRIGDQINACYQYGIYDGCAVLIRRLIEMLLILSFKKHDLSEEIKGADGDYMQLSSIISKAVASKDLDLSRNTKQFLPFLCIQGHLAAHNPFYCAIDDDFGPDTRLRLRVVVTELLNKSGIAQ